LVSLSSLLEYFGAIPIDERVVIDGRFVSAAGVTAGIDGAREWLQLARRSSGSEIQLHIHAPEPPTVVRQQAHRLRF